MEIQSIPHDDVSSLAWVQDELRKSLDAAHKALRRTLKETEAAAGSDLDDVEPALLRAARGHIHQSVGVLELVGLPAGAALLRGSEAAVQRFIAKPQTLTTAAVEAIERGSFALQDYLTRRLGGKPVSPVALFPQYRALHDLAGTPHVHPADLWPAEWQGQPLPAEAQAAPRGADAQLMAEFESQVLASMRPGGAAAMERLGDLSAGLAAGAAEAAGPGAAQVTTLWQLAAGFFQAQSLGLLAGDVYAKRIPSRLLAQLRQQSKGEAPAAHRLVRELLFLCAQAAGVEPGRAPRLDAVRSTYPATREGPLNYQDVQLGRYDPAWITQARKRVANAKDTWSAVAGDEMHRLGGLNEQFALVAESLRRLLPGGEALGDSLARTVADTVQKAVPPEPAVAMEVATSLLYVEAALEDGAFDQPEQTPRVQHLAERLDAVHDGAAPQPLETWMEELYRRVSDRQTMGSVVQELRTALSESEKLIDQFFRVPAEPAVLIPVPAQLQAMRGVFSVLGLDKATQAVLRMRDDVDALVAAGPQAQHAQPLFERLAGNLSALSFLIDLLGVQPQLVKSLFGFDAETGLLTSRMGRHSTPLEVAAASHHEPEGAAKAPDPSAFAAMDEMPQEILRPAPGPDESSVVQAEEMPAPPPPLTATPTAPAVTGLEADDEMRDVFLEEAREVVGTARGALADLESDHAAIDLLTTLRRSFHTFKGSARMVGLNEFGEAAWACEQLYNDVLARQQPASQAFVRISGDLLSHLAAWIEAVAQGRDGSWSSRPVREVADALRLEGRELSIVTPAPTEPVALPALAGFPAGLVMPAASDLDLPATADSPEPVGLDFVFDLGEAPTETVLLQALPEPSEPFASAPLPLLPEVMELPEPAPETPDDALPPIVADDVPNASAAQTAPLAASVIEPLSPSAEIDAMLAAITGMGALRDAPESSTVPFEPSDLIVALHPSSPGALAGAEVAAPDAPAETEAPGVPDEPDEPVSAIVTDEAFASDQIKVIGSLQISIPLFNIFLTEADELSRRLAVELSEWAHELDRPVGETAVSLAHSLGGGSATVGFIELSALSRRLEQALTHSQRLGHGTPEDAALFLEASDEVRRLLHQFAAGFLKQAAPGLLDRLSAHEIEIDERMTAQQARAGLAELSPTQVSIEDTSEDAATDFFGHGGYADTAPFPVPNTDFADLGVAEFKPYVAPISLEEPGQRGVSALAFDSDEDIDSVDVVDAELFPIFEEEALELLPELASHLRDWSLQPSQTMHASASMRTLHTLKGGARLAGAMRLGEMAHRLETAIERLLPQDEDGLVDAAGIEQLLGRADGLSSTFEALRQSDAQAYGERTSGFNHLGAPLDAPAQAPVHAPLPALSDVPTVTDEVVPTEAQPVAPPVSLATDATLAPTEPLETLRADPVALTPTFDWTRFVDEEAARPPVAPAERAPLQTAAAVRVRTQLLDRMVNQAGEVSIARARLESEVGTIKGSLGDLNDNLQRLRGQLRDIELQAETQMATRMEAAKAAAEAFDPLEFDRFTRFQELTRMMAESVNDVATVQRTLQRTLETAEDELAAQARLTRDLQDDLLRTRMVEFEGLSERLYRVVRQTAKETGKQVRLDIVGGSIEVDRGVLDRMTGAFEHLLRNCITHGIEPAAERVAAGKEAAGSIVVALHQEGNEVSVEFRDDGAGLDLARIREKGLASGLIAAGANPSDADLANLIFMPGFSTAEKVTELAGRGVGMDVVRSEVNALGGRIETASAPGQGTSFKLVLPLTTAVTQVVMLRCGDARVAVPATLIEVVRRASAAEVELGYQTGAYAYGDQTLAMLWLGALLQISGRSNEPTMRTTPVLVIRSAQQRIALHVDEVLGNQEVVVKNLGPQLSSLPGLAGMTLLASGAVTLIYNPVALATVYGEAARRAMATARSGEPAEPSPSAASLLPTLPLVLVVDDSLTVRRVTQRLLVREGYRVVLAKDGFEALERLKDERPAVVLSDIEMPRMDGFDLLRNIRSDVALAALPVIMITSRIAQKHRDYANQLGVNHYLGKPYSEEELLSLIGRYCAQPDVVI